jgi:hypothetical protein
LLDVIFRRVVDEIDHAPHLVSARMQGNGNFRISALRLPHRLLTA